MVLVLTCCVSADYTFKRYLKQDAVANLKSKKENDTGAICDQILLDWPDPGECRVPSLGNVAALVVDRKAYTLLDS